MPRRFAPSRFVAFIDPVGNRTTYQYDKDGNKTKTTDALGHSATWTYDDARRVLTATDKLGQEKDYTYFANDLVKTETDKYAGSTVVNVKTYTYNADNQVLTAGDNNGTVIDTYDGFGRLQTQTGVEGFTLTYSFDAANRLVGMTDTIDALGHDSRNVYDADGRVIAFIDPVGKP